MIGSQWRRPAHRSSSWLASFVLIVVLLGLGGLITGAIWVLFLLLARWDRPAELLRAVRRSSGHGRVGRAEGGAGEPLVVGDVGGDRRGGRLIGRDLVRADRGHRVGADDRRVDDEGDHPALGRGRARTALARAAGPPRPPRREPGRLAASVAPATTCGASIWSSGSAISVSGWTWWS